MKQVILAAGSISNRTIMKNPTSRKVELHANRKN